MSGGLKLVSAERLAEIDLWSINCMDLFEDMEQLPGSRCCMEFVEEKHGWRRLLHEAFENSEGRHLNV